MAEDMQEGKALPMLTRGQIAFIIYAYFKINDVQGRATGINDLLNIELRCDSLKMFELGCDKTDGDGS